MFKLPFNYKMKNKKNVDPDKPVWSGLTLFVQVCLSEYLG